MKTSDVVMLGVGGVVLYSLLSKKEPEAQALGGGEGLSLSLGNIGGGEGDSGVLGALSDIIGSLASAVTGGGGGGVSGLTDTFGKVLDTVKAPVTDINIPGLSDLMESINKITDIINAGKGIYKTGEETLEKASEISKSLIEKGKDLVDKVIGEAPTPLGKPGSDAEVDLPPIPSESKIIADYGAAGRENWYDYLNPSTWWGNDYVGWMNDATLQAREEMGNFPHPDKDDINWKSEQRMFEANITNRARQILSEQHGLIYKGLPPGTEVIEVEKMSAGIGGITYYIPGF